MGVGYETRKHSSIYLHDYRHGVDVLLLGMGCEMSEVGKWIGWNGGEFPVHPKTVVEVVFDNPSKKSYYEHIAENVCWQNGEGPSDIIAYRVIKEYREPREFWIAVDPDGGVDFVLLSDENLLSGWTKIHVREVINETA